MSEFIHLHCHSEYSMLDSAIRLPALCERAVSFGMEACAVTDHGNLCAAAEFQKVCREYGIRPIFGCEIYTCPDRRLRDGGAPHHLILLARTQEGWSNLSHLVSEAWISGFCGKPRADWELLSRFRDGLTCLSACLQGAVPGAILRGDMDGARERALRLASLFPGHFYLELQRTGLPRQEYVNQRLMELGESLRLPLAATNDCHYLGPGDAEARDVLLCVQAGKKLSGPGHPHSGTKSLFFKSPAEMAEAFADCPEAIANTVRIAEDCRAEIPSGKHFFPAYPVPPGTTTEQEFRRIAEEGLRKRLSEKPSGPPSDETPYWKRLRHEMDVITRMGFPAYFLVVHEFVTWARDNGIPVGPGRGSAGGSLTAWAMRITDFDPLEYGLIFERFLNPGRSSLPDIDVDVCERRRGRILRHLRERYGEDCVAQIAAFSTLKMRAAVQDAGRSLGMGFQERTRLASFFPSFTHHRRIADVIRETPQLRDMAEKDENAARVLAVSLRIEGLVRQAGIHAAGVVMSGGPLADRVPVMLGRHGERVTQFDGPMVEAAGLVKFDILGLANMTIIQDTIDAVAREGRPAPDLRTLPLDDPAVYRLYSRADTDGVFQMESAGMRKYLTLLRPERFSDIVALLALYRPGPLESGMSQEFIRRRHGESPVRYPHPALEACLRDTYGVILYQEQVMQIAETAAGYTAAEADTLRRAMSKKKAEEMAGERARFLRGAAERGFDRKTAETIFGQMETFASYGFNKAHSVAYALTSYYTAYLKTHYPAEFMAALLTAVMRQPERLAGYLSRCRERGPEVLPPSVNTSLGFFSAQKGRIVFGLDAVRGVGSAAAGEIVRARKDGPFRSLGDFLSRVSLRTVTKRAVSSLIRCGALDDTGESRESMLSRLDAAISRARLHPARGAGLLRFLPDYIPEGGRARKDTSGPAPDPAARLRDEKDILGVYLSGHPLTSLKGEAARLGCLPLSALSSLRPGAKVRLCVMISGFREIRDRQKRRMAVARLEDQESYAHAYIFSQAYTPSVRELLREAADSDLPLFIEGRTEEDAGDGEDEEKRSAVLAEQVLPFGEACARSRRPAVIRVSRCLVTPEGLAGFREVLEKFPGPIAVCASIPGPGGDTLLRLGRIRVRPSPAFYEAITIWRKAAPEDSQAELPLTEKEAEAAFAAAGIPASAGRNGKNSR